MSLHSRYADKIDARLRIARDFEMNPAIFEGLRWLPCRIRILLVADSFLYFSDENFGLSDLIETLKTETLPYARFEISVAHRDGNLSDARMAVGNPHVEARIQSFRFDDASHFDPANYDQIWLFGAARSRLGDGAWSNKLEDSELRVLVEFMNDGGGIFATGDHEDLGAAMGGFLPRVRQMRRWFYPDPGPKGEALAPKVDGPGRFDTNREGHDSGYQFDDQSDDIPQPITPKMYTRHSGPFTDAVYPHPVLCGIHGPITVLPDHPHESQCTGAADPDASGTLAGLAFTEFPAATDGGPRPLPEIIATSRVIGGHGTTGKTGVTVARTFGAISAYDGHRAGVGRVLTDATWHHFININLTGDTGAGTPKNLGFLVSAFGQDALDEIRNYFRNIALWLSPAPRIRCMRNWGLLWVIYTHRLTEVFDPDIRFGSASLVDYLIVGRHARDAIGKFASQCQKLRWTWDFVLPEIEIPFLIDVGDPWFPREPVEDLRDLETKDLFSLEWLGDVALGGAILALREEALPMSQEMLDSFDETGEEIAREGARAALREALPFVEESISDFGRVLGHAGR